MDGGGPADYALSGGPSLPVSVGCVQSTSEEASQGLFCTGTLAADSATGAVAFRPISESRSPGHHVIILLDMSGSTKGFVDGDTHQEGPTFISGGGSLQAKASDYEGDRISAARRLSEQLNAEDSVAFLAFGEGLDSGLQVPCQPAVGDPFMDLAACFGSTETLDETWQVEDLKSKVGRSNLWEAVGEAWDFLSTQESPEHPAHIVVFTDGPDTCEPDAPVAEGAPPCDVPGYGQVQTRMDLVESGSPDVRPVHLNFIQFESLGYPGRDPRQVQAACRTGGHYQYINSLDMGSFQASLGEALQVASDGVRHSLSGHWQIPVSTSALVNLGPTPDGLVVVEGHIQIPESIGFVSHDTIQSFGVGTGEDIYTAIMWDRRPTLVLP